MKWTVVWQWSSYDSGGMRSEEVEAETAEEAARLASIDTSESDEVLAFQGEAVDVTEVVERIRWEKQAAYSTAKEAEAEANERAEYERLKVKYG